MRYAVLSMVGALQLAGCVAAVEGGQQAGEQVSDGEHATPMSPDDWQFRFDETREEVTARRRGAELVYPLREMGTLGGELRAVFRGHDGATWSIPAGGDVTRETVEAVGQTQDPYVIVGPPPRISTPPVYGAGSHPPGGGGHTGHGRPPGIDRATWGRMCLYASVVGATLTCAAAGISCAAGTFVTIGGLAVPCTLITAMACATTGGAFTLAALDCPSTARGK